MPDIAPRTPQTDLDHWRPHFRSLADWNIYIDPKADESNGSWINADTRNAIIFEWRGDGLPPHDYILHELLHVAFAEASRSPRKHQGCPRDSCKCEDEERFIQDLCDLMTMGT